MSAALISEQSRYGRLQRVMLFDLQRRQQVLRNETDHLIDAINYRLPLENEDGAGSSLALLSRIRDATKEIIREVSADIRERADCEAWWERLTATMEEAHVLHPYECFYQVWHAKMLVKASVIAERLGELHDRLGQQLERTNPDHPNPILRRRAEQGQADKFLCEHIKWVHRDMARFTKYDLQADYPYNEVPATFYSWQYEYSSKQHSFISFFNYELWKRRVQSYSDEPLKPAKFTSIGISYWIPERQVVHPIIGHEIAHQVLQDIYGKGGPHLRLEHNDDELSRLLRRLIGCAEAWMWRREGARAATESWSLAREIVCDLLAAERYGYAYLYAWILEISEIDALADFMHDSFGMLQQVHFGADRDAIDLEYIRREVFGPARTLATTVRPDVYYRGKVLTRFLLSHDRETDDLAYELVAEVENWLERYLDLASGAYAEVPEAEALAHGRKFEREFARDLAACVTEEYSLLTRLEDAIRDQPSGFVAAAKRHWKTSDHKPQDFCLYRQVMTDGFRQAYIALIQRFRPKLFMRPEECATIRMLHDSLWRVEWVIDNRSAGVEKMDPKGRNELRALNSLAIDDYLYRTANPHRLLQAICQQKVAILDDVLTFINDLTDKSNSISDLRLKMMYEPEPYWVRALEDARRRGAEHHVVNLGHGRSIELEDADLKQLGPLIFTSENVEPLRLLSAQLHGFHLVSLKPACPKAALEEIVGKYLLDSEYPVPSGVTFRSLLLGRYDAMAIGRFPDGDERRFDERDSEAEKSTPAKFAADSPSNRRPFAPVSRLKRLVPLCPLLESISAPIAAVLISLKWDGSRLTFGRWLQSQTEGLGITSMPYLSDGWEDAVVFFPLDGCVAIRGWVDAILGFVALLNASPLVAGTETLFPPTVLEYETSLRYRFVCARAGKGLPTVCDEITSWLRNANCVVENLAGAKDVQVLVPGRDAASRVYGSLHQLAADGGVRVETRISWPMAKADSLDRARSR